MRLPGDDWRERHGAAGVQADKRRNSPIVELSLLLVSAAGSAGTAKQTLPPVSGRGLPCGDAFEPQAGAELGTGSGRSADTSGDAGREIHEVTMLAAGQAECIQHGLRTIAFCKTRKLCELVTAYTRETLRTTAPHLLQSIAVYRAGYSPAVRACASGRRACSAVPTCSSLFSSPCAQHMVPHVSSPCAHYPAQNAVLNVQLHRQLLSPVPFLQERREVEQALFKGELMAVAATNALELGVDIGSLDITLHLGFPGTPRSCPACQLAAGGPPAQC